MAKLEDLVTPTELLDSIKSGTLKQELVKKYRASEQDLALMLQPLYRKGKLTKGEFNSFFKGIKLPPLSRPEPGTPEENAAPNETSHDAPTEMLPTSPPEQEPVPAPPPEPEERQGTSEVGLKLTSSGSVQLEPQVPSRPDEPKTSPEKEAGGKEFAAAESAGITALLDMIYTRLNSIDDRLAQIEKKVGPRS